MQQLMQEMFPDEMPYIDNLAFGTKGDAAEAWPIHRARIIKTLEICRKYNLKLNLNKCIFQCGAINQPIECLGRLTTGEWHSIDDKTAEKIKNMAKPTTTKVLASTLAKLNWIRPYVQQFGQLAAPLYQFTGPLYAGKKIKWTDEKITRTVDNNIFIDIEELNFE